MTLNDHTSTDIEAAFLRRQRDLILAATGDGIYGLDLHGNTMFVNPAAARACGYSIEEMLGANLHDLIHHTRPDGRHYHVHECPIYAATNDGKIHRVSSEVFWRKDGSCFPVEYVSTPIWDEGKLTGAVVSFRDITESKMAEEALRESEERYRTIFDDTHAAVFLIDGESHRVMDSNKQTCSMLGYTDADLFDLMDRDIFVGRTQDVETFWRSVEEDGNGETEDLFCLAADGTRVPVRLSASKMQVAGHAGLIVLANDIRRRNAAEARARHLQSELHHVSRLGAMGEMASAMAHELNQPLAAVMNYIQASRRVLESDKDDVQEKATEYMEKAMAQAARAGDIIRGLRSFVEKSEADLSFESINTIVEEAILLTISGAVREHIQFEAVLANGLPETLVDKIRIQQVVVNIVRNAIEAMCDKVDGSLIVATRQTDDAHIEISVCDNGTGLSEEQLGEVFQSFMTTKQQGMGVGLSICRSIVEDHDGRLWAENNAVDGVTFFFTLPVVTAGSSDGG